MALNLLQESNTDDNDKSWFVAPPPKEMNGWTTMPSFDISRVRDGPPCNPNLQLPVEEGMQEGGGTISFVDVVSRYIGSRQHSCMSLHFYLWLCRQVSWTTDGGDSGLKGCQFDFEPWRESWSSWPHWSREIFSSLDTVQVENPSCYLRNSMVDNFHVQQSL